MHRAASPRAVVPAGASTRAIVGRCSHTHDLYAIGECARTWRGPSPCVFRDTARPARSGGTAHHVDRGGPARVGAMRLHTARLELVCRQGRRMKVVTASSSRGGEVRRIQIEGSSIAHLHGIAPALSVRAALHRAPRQRGNFTRHHRSSVRGLTMRTVIDWNGPGIELNTSPVRRG